MDGQTKRGASKSERAKADRELIAALKELADDPRVSDELIGMRVRNELVNF